MEKLIKSNPDTAVLHAEKPIKGSESITEKHRMFWAYFKSAGIGVQLLLILKAIVGWWLTFLPVYPFLGLGAYYLNEAGYETGALALVLPVILPLAIASLPFLLLGVLTWAVFSYIPGKLGVSAIVSAIYILAMLYMALRISVRYWPGWRCELLRIRSPWKTDRL